ncbi:GNAT family N-acetyltransferase [Erythrobacter sp. NAP1]|uniref:GNAT family N-acetyltransferase n=1 Tax=Erythrobacter sp. NAP1 TaxID=237727 RepID=UPI000311D20C|nr:GNAT family N-acetyltransferase [Erythrobacter sp. NAP1]
MPLQQGDQAFVERLLQCELVRRYLGGPLDSNELGPTFARYLDLAANHYVWAVRDVAAAGDPIGLVFLDRHKRLDAPELSFQFDAGSWGQGYAFEACSTAKHFARQNSGASRIVAETQSVNCRSVALLHRLGFKEMERLIRFGELQSVFVA